MRFVRTVFICAILLAPSFTFAAAVIVSSPFAHVNPLFLADENLAGSIEFPQNSAQASAVAAALPKGLTRTVCSGDTERKFRPASSCLTPDNNICTSDTVDILNNPLMLDVKVKCLCPDEKSLEKVDCATGQINAGTVTYAGKTVSKCSKEGTAWLSQIKNICSDFSKLSSGSSAKCVAIGDSNMQLLAQQTACNGGLSLGGQPATDCKSQAVHTSTALAQCSAYASDIPSRIDNLPDKSLEGSKVVIGVCSNDSSECTQNCPGPNCPVSKAIQSAIGKGANPNDIFLAGVNDSKYPGLNSLLDQVANDNQIHFTGVPSASDMDGVHFSSAGLNNIMKDVGQIQVAPDGLFADANVPAANIATDHVNQIGSPTVAVSGVGQNLAPLCDSLGGCGDNACNVASPSLTCRTNNPGALTYAPWQAKYGGQPCGMDNNTTCFPTMEQGIAAHAGLLVGPAYYGSGDATIADAASKYSTANQSQYASFISNNTGISLDQTIDPSNPQQLGSIMMAQSRFENGKGVIYTPDQLEKGLTLMYSSQTTPVGSALPPLNGISNGLVGSKTPTPISESIITGDWTARSDTPPSSTQPEKIYYVTAGNSGLFGANQMMLGNMLGGSLGNLMNAFKSSTAPTTQTTMPPSPPPPAATLSLTADPATVQRGNATQLNWTSNATLLNPPCQITQNGTKIRDGNAGTQSVPTSSTTPATLTFTLMCKAAVDGQTVQQQAVVNVQ